MPFTGSLIGSGFGGGVAALRLAQAGVPVTVLGRGKRWPTGPNAETFPHIARPDRRLLWHGTVPSAVRPVQQLLGTPLGFDPYVGLIEPVLGVNMLAMCAAGVGGGSLVYQGMTLQPSREVFESVLPSELDYDLMDRVHYPRVASMLKVATAPDSLINTPNYFAARAFKSRAERAGYPVEKIPMPIDWSYAEAELRGEMKPSYTTGDAAMGVNNGGKHSVDVTYIQQAEATGLCEVATHHNVTDVERSGDRWIVRVEATDDSGRVTQHKVITTTALVMAAGSVNTTKLLVRAKALGGSHPRAVGRRGSQLGHQRRPHLHVEQPRRGLRRAGRPRRLRQQGLGRPRDSQHHHPGRGAARWRQPALDDARRLRRQHGPWPLHLQRPV